MPATNTELNPAFRFQQLQKLGNVLTSRSNVYAMWITMGYFEVQAVPASVANPDGYRLVRELGSDTGDIKRHRAFYVIDLLIPVGSQRGQNINVRNSIILNRFIE